MKTFEVIVYIGRHEIQADGFIVNGLGALKFVKAGEDIAAFAPGHWLSVGRLSVEDDREGP